MQIEQALKIIDNAINPQTLNDVQELVLRGCWDKKTYQQIAEESGYDHDYIRVIGYELWKELSNIFGQKVTKNNLHSILRKQENLEIQVKEKKEFLLSDNKQVFSLEIPDGIVGLDSPFYIKRYPIEESCYQEIEKDGALIRIRGVLKTGKSSLKNRILAYAKTLDYYTIKINFNEADEEILQELNKFLRWFCANIAHKLDLKPLLNDYWDDDIGSKISSTIYLQERILQELNKPLVIGLDSVNILFEYPQIAKNFLPLLRSWYEEAKDSNIWKKLRLIVSHSTEIYIPLDINQSPFNVGLCINLPDFNSEQVTKLAKLHNLNWKENCEIKQLMDFIGGHPYLIRLALFQIKRDNLTIEEFIKQALTLSGIYNKHLRFHWQTLEKYPQLMTAIKYILNNEQQLKLEPITTYKLESMGLIKINGDNINLSCQLYYSYFSSQIQ